MAKWKQLHDIAKCELEIDLDTIEYMQRNGKGTEIHFNTGKTLSVRESLKDIPKPQRQSSSASRAR
jgi:hypothetical protein